MKCSIWLASNRFRVHGGSEGWILTFCEVIISILLKRQRHMVLGFSLSHIRPHLCVLLWVRVRLWSFLSSCTECFSCIPPNISFKFPAQKQHSQLYQNLTILKPSETEFSPNSQLPSCAACSKQSPFRHFTFFISQCPTFPPNYINEKTEQAQHENF